MSYTPDPLAGCLTEPTATLPDAPEILDLASRWVMSQGWLLWSMVMVLGTYFAGVNHVSLGIGLCLFLLPPVIGHFKRLRASGLGWEPLFIVAAIFVLWNLGVSVVREPALFSSVSSVEYAFGSLVLLPILLAAGWYLASRTAFMRACGHCLGVVAAIAAVVSLIAWHVAGLPIRLRNPLVHGGLHPVSTGILFSFAAVWLSATWDLAARRWHKLGLLVAICILSWTVFLTLSRGAVLVLAVGTAVNLCWRFQSYWRRSLPPTILVAVLGSIFFCSPTLLVPDSILSSPNQHADVVLMASPGSEFQSRMDSGRFGFYRAGLRGMNSWEVHLFGRGMWVGEKQMCRELNSAYTHFHSLFVSTYVHSGIVGLLLLATLIGIGLRKAIILAKLGQSCWLALMLCGLAGLVFDGSSVGSLLTYVRWDALIFWLPIVGAAGAHSRLRQTLPAPP